MLKTGIKKKLVAAAKKKQHQDLLPWIRSITNHLWYSSSDCGGEAEVNIIITNITLLLFIQY